MIRFVYTTRKLSSDAVAIIRKRLRPTDMSPDIDCPSNRSSDAAPVLRLDPIIDYVKHSLPPSDLGW
jgi:hypothetical protein